MLSSVVERLYNIADVFHTRRIRNLFAGKNIGFVIDVGAHKGEFIRLVIDHSVPVFVFEPQKSVHTTLESAIAKHNVRKFFKCAASDKAGEVNLYVNSLSSTTSILLPDETSTWMRFKKAILGGQLIKTVEKVSVTTLDQAVLPEVGGLDKGLLKIDVEGNEGRVLAGAYSLLSSGKVEFVQIERARYKIYKDDSPDPVEILHQFGFKEYKTFLFPLLNFSDVIFQRVANPSVSHRDRA